MEIETLIIEDVFLRIKICEKLCFSAVQQRELPFSEPKQRIFQNLKLEVNNTKLYNKLFHKKSNQVYSFVIKYKNQKMLNKVVLKNL